MGEVKPFPGFFDFLDLCCREKIGVYIISFKTRYPFEGERYDLHEAAFDWMKENRVYPPENSQSAIAGVFFEPTRIMKIQRIIALGCTHFIDDLPEILFHPEFPHYIKKILFDPDNLHRSYPEFRKMRSWHEIIALFEEKELRKGGS